MSNFGIKISRPGYSVTDTTTVDTNLVMNTDYPTFKIYRVMKCSPGTRTAHGLTYPPAFFYMVEVSTGNWQQHNANYYSPFTYVAVDSTYVYVAENAQSPTSDTYVFLFTDPLNE